MLFISINGQHIKIWENSVNQ